MKSNPRISVIIPVYNVEKYLSKCLDSVLNQTFIDFEVICVNDGSTDNSLKILNKYAKKDTRIKVFTKKNGGASTARNYAIKKATGEYIYFLDSDDFIHKNLLEVCFNLAEQEKSGIVFIKKHTGYRTRLIIRQILHLSTNIKPFNLNKNYDHKNINYITTNDVFSYAGERKIKDKKLQVNHCYIVQGFYKKNLIQDVSFIEGIIFEDVAWFLEVLSKNPIITITNLKLYYYVPNIHSVMSSNNQLTKINSLNIALKHIISIYKETPYLKKVKENYIHPFINYMIKKCKTLKNKDDKLKAEFVINKLKDEILSTKNKEM